MLCSFMLTTTKQSNARHHTSARKPEVVESRRVAGRVYSVVRQESDYAIAQALPSAYSTRTFTTSSSNTSRCFLPPESALTTLLGCAYENPFNSARAPGLNLCTRRKR